MARKKPEELKMNRKLLDSAINIAVKSENKVDKDLCIANMKAYANKPDYKIAGPIIICTCRTYQQKSKKVNHNVLAPVDLPC